MVVALVVLVMMHESKVINVLAEADEEAAEGWSAGVPGEVEGMGGP